MVGKPKLKNQIKNNTNPVGASYARPSQIAKINFSKSVHRRTRTNAIIWWSAYNELPFASERPTIDAIQQVNRLDLSLNAQGCSQVLTTSLAILWYGNLAFP